MKYTRIYGGASRYLHLFALEAPRSVLGDDVAAMRCDARRFDLDSEFALFHLLPLGSHDASLVMLFDY